MKKFVSVFFLVMVLFSLVSTDGNAQRFSNRNRYAIVGVSLNAMNYFGDIVPEADFTSLRLKSTRPNIGVSYGYRMFPRITFEGNLSWGRITGDDRKSASANEADNSPRYQRNLNFRNDIKELSARAVFDLFENRGAFARRPDFTPYGFVGVAVFHHNPKAYYNGTRMEQKYYELQPLGTEGQNISGQGYPEPYSKIQFSIPLGIGFKYKIDQNWDLGFEIGWRKTFTDYIDDVSGFYASKADLLANPSSGSTAAILSDRSNDSGFNQVADPSAPGYTSVMGFGQKGDQRGDSTDKDWYIITGIHLNYILPTRTRGPKFR